MGTPTRKLAGSFEEETKTRRLTHDDPMASAQTDLTKLGAEAAWTAFDADSTAGTGPAVTIAVLDTGVDSTHGDLVDQMWHNLGEIPNNGLDDDGNGYVDDVHGVDTVNHDGDPMDDAWHGTSVAGIVAGKGNNNFGIASLAGTPGNAKLIKIMAIKVLDEHLNGRLSDVLEGLEYAVGNGARISVHAWGARSPKARVLLASVFETIGGGSAAGPHLVVGAAGNSGLDLDALDDYIPCVGGGATNVMCVTR